jgi:hypothetical protein
MLTIDTIPLWNAGVLPASLLVFSVQTVTAAATAEFFELQASRRILFVLGRHVVALFALRTLQNNVISRHILSF